MYIPLDEGTRRPHLKLNRVCSFPIGGLCLFFLIIGIALVTGHAIELVAGVNSMTESERRGYNLKKV